MFCFSYLTATQSEDNWKKDVAGLELLKKSGIRDLYINPVNRAASISTAAWQRVIDYLDANGFRYGVELADGFDEPFEVYIVPPDAPRAVSRGMITLDAPPASEALYVLMDNAGKAVDSGERDLTKGNLGLEAPAGAAKLAVVSRTRMDVQSSGFGNYWEAYPNYRKRLLEKFTSVKFGSGLRFFVDPFLNEMGMRGDAPSAIPDSPRFREEFAEYLRKKYPKRAELARAWELGETFAGTYAEAARLVPMQQGAGYAMDPQVARVARCGPAEWRDLSSFRDESVRRYMNDVADLLKSKIADVPVIYKWTHPHPIFTNTNSTGGFDGLGMEIYTTGAELGRIGVHVLAQVEEAARNQWLIVTETQDTSSAAKPTMGYPSEEQMHSDLDWMRKAGAKGFFVFGFKLLPEPEWNNFELLRDPKQLGWLADYNSKLEANRDFPTTRPYIVRFPVGAGTSATPKVFADGSCWIPTTRNGRSLQLPPGLDGYFFDDDIDTSVLWAPNDARNITLPVPIGTKPLVSSLTGIPLGKLDERAGHLSLTLGQEPIIVCGLQPMQVFPSDATRTSIEEFRAMIAKAQARGMVVADFKQALAKGDKIDVETNPRAAYDAIRQPMTALAQKLSYLWIEGESCTDHNFNDVVLEPGCSGGKYLRLMKSAEPLGADGYRARYAFDAKIESDYEIWLAGTPLTLNWASPVMFYIDSSEPRAVTAAPQDPYHRDLFWTRLGTVKIGPGRHVLTIQIAGRRKAPDTDYVLYIDALVISPSAFKPNGINRP